MLKVIVAFVVLVALIAAPFVAAVRVFDGSGSWLAANAVGVTLQVLIALIVLPRVKRVLL